MVEDVKVRENRLRRAADRRGYKLIKSRSRDEQAIDFGLYALIDVDTNGAVNPAIAQRWVCSWDLDDVEEYLNEEAEAPASGAGSSFDWEIEQKRLLDEKNKAHKDSLQLQPRQGVTTTEALAAFESAVQKSQASNRRWDEFLQRRLREDPAWKPLGSYMSPRP